jgi:hypothetical protein
MIANDSSRLESKKWTTVDRSTFVTKSLDKASRRCRPEAMALAVIRFSIK